jgi:tetratricopeptide (TPR) repeat protein
MTNPAATRATMLMQVRRYDEAVAELRRALAAEPNEAELHALLAYCLLELDSLEEATSEAEAAVGLAPHFAFPFYVLARVWQERNHPDRAMTAIDEAIRINPEDADYHAFKAGLHYNASRWRDALSEAETGLHFDAEHVQSNNLRAMALVKLGRKEEAGATIDAALAREPDNSWTHANKGWSLLEARHTGDALQHFRESLRLDPTNNYARAGLVEGLKARNPIYGLFLRYLLWMAKLPPRTQMGVVIGGYIGFRMVRTIAADNPGLAPYLNPLLYAYMVFAWFTWLAQPVFNLLLRLHPLGKHALSADQRRETNWFGLTVATAGICFGLSFLGGWFLPFDLLALYVIVLALPIHLVFQCSPGWPRLTMIAGTGLLAVTAASAMIALYSLSVRPFRNLNDFYWLGIVIAIWGGQALTLATPRR